MIKGDFEKTITCYFKRGKRCYTWQKKIILNNYELITFILEEIQITLKKTENFSKILWFKIHFIV